MSAQEAIVRITDGEERISHWLLAGTCLFCLLTGLGLMFQSWNIIPALLGGYYATKLMHIYSGVIFTGMLVRSYFMWKKDCEFESDDLKWVLKAGGYLWPVKDLPPVYKYNAGQKAFFWCLMVFGAVIAATGFLMWLWNPDIVPQIIALWAYMLHALAAVVIGAFIVIHIYLGTVGNPGTVSAMFTGYVTRAWCETHCPRWLAERDNRKLGQKAA